MTDIAAFSPPLIDRSAPPVLAASGEARARHYRIDEFGSLPRYLAGARLSIYSTPGDCEAIWRDAVERCAGTLFQCFEWHAAFHATIGVAEGVEPQIVHLATIPAAPCCCCRLRYAARGGCGCCGFRAAWSPITTHR